MISPGLELILFEWHYQGPFCIRGWGHVQQLQVVHGKSSLLDIAVHTYNIPLEWLRHLPSVYNQARGQHPLFMSWVTPICCSSCPPPRLQTTPTTVSISSHVNLAKNGQPSLVASTFCNRDYPATQIAIPTVAEALLSIE